MTRRPALVVLVALGIAWLAGGSLTARPVNAPPAAQASSPAVPGAPLSDADAERFLQTARVTKTRGAGKGITNSLRATLSDGTVTHDAHIQTIDQSKREFKSTQGTEFNFRDSWSFNVAAYKLDRLLGLRMVPVTVARRWKTDMGSYTWWIDDVKMDEAERLKQKIAPPDPDAWNQGMQLVRLFDQLILNVDRNLGNLMITNDWNIWAIDHTRAFRTAAVLKTPGNVARCDRQVFAKLKELDREGLRKEIGSYLQTWELDALLKRRDAIVAIIDTKGEAGLFDRQAR